jgi:hypothetical protein
MCKAHLQGNQPLRAQVYGLADGAAAPVPHIQLGAVVLGGHCRVAGGGGGRSGEAWVMQRGQGVSLVKSCWCCRTMYDQLEENNWTQFGGWVNVIHRRGEHCSPLHVRILPSDH